MNITVHMFTGDTKEKAEEISKELNIEDVNYSMLPNDKYNYLDLINDINYTTDNNKKAYVLEETLVEIDIRDFREDYNYLLSRHNDKKKTKKKHWYNR